MDALLGFININELLGQPEVASKHGGQIDNMLEVVHWFMHILGIGWTIFFIYVLFRFNRRSNPKASYKGVTSHFTTHIEVLVVVVEIVLLLGFAFPLWSKQVDSFPDMEDEEVVKIRAVGEQFSWTFHYAGEDGLFGLVRPDYINAGNRIGLVKEDPNAHDDFISPILRMPKDRHVVIHITSKDVIHNLALIPMRIQQDAIPGMEIPIWFVPTKEGNWDIVCAQLCGAGHATMVGKMEVITQEEFDPWHEQQSATQLAANAPASEEEAAEPQE